MHRLFKILRDVVGGLLAATIVMEVAMSILESTPLWHVLPVSEIAAYAADPYTGYRHRALAQGYWLKENRTHVRISSLGLRDRERPRIPGDGPRVAVVGDSIIEAFQVDQSATAVTVAEKLLDARHPGTEVVNLGLAGATPPVEIERLRSVGAELKADLAVIFVSAMDFLPPDVMDDSSFPGYRATPDGQMKLSFHFRESRGYKFRMSEGGRIFYWLLDHSAAARILNSRKNVGLFAEWPQAQQPQTPMNGPVECNDSALGTALTLWRDGVPKIPDAVLTAFIRDLAQIQSEQNIPIIVAAQGIPFECPQLTHRRGELVNLMQQRFAAANMKMVDFEAPLAARLGPDGMRTLRGFGATLGRGHLNNQGNRAYGETLASVIESALAQSPPARLNRTPSR